MFKKLILQVILSIINSAVAYAATTPDPMDDMIAAMLKKLVEGLMTAKTHADVLAAADDAKADFSLKFPKP